MKTRNFLKTRMAIAALVLAMMGDFLAVTAAAAEPFLVRDINETDGVGSAPFAFAKLKDDMAVFLARDDLGSRVWRTDGSTAGTQPVSDPFPEPISWGREMGGLFFFPVGDTLWRSDGTGGGTFPLMDTHRLRGFLVYAPVIARVFFLTRDVDGYFHLWVTDGTRAGTRSVTILHDKPSPIFVELEAVGGRALVWIDVSTDGTPGVLWSSDGTTSGTSIILEGVERSRRPNETLVPNGTNVLFVRRTQGEGNEVWRTDGTATGTWLVGEQGEGPSEHEYISPWAPTAEGVVFVSHDYQAGPDLWRVSLDGSTLTKLAHFDVLPPDTYVNTDDRIWEELKTVDDRVVFFANDGVHGFEPWVTDGTSGGTRALGDLCPGPCHSTQSFEALVVARFGPAIFFRANDGVHGFEVWVWDGDASNARLLFDGCPGPCSSQFRGGTTLGNRLLLARSDSGPPVFEIWSTDGTEAGTFLVRDGMEIAAISGGVQLGDALVFHGSDFVTGRELWRTDGTASGTALVADLKHVGNRSSRPESFVPWNDRLVFIADDTTHGREPWISDGTATGTRLIADLEPGRGTSFATSSDGYFVPAGDRFYFSAATSLAGREVWVSDGTVAGTQAVTAFEDPDVFLFLETAEGANGRLLFRVESEVWFSDGTPAGTRRVSPEEMSVQTNAPQRLALDDRFFFVGHDNASGGSRLVRVSADGTSVVVVDRDGRPIALDQDTELVSLTGATWFVGDAAEHGVWRVGADGPAELMTPSGPGFPSPKIHHATASFLVVEARFGDGWHSIHRSGRREAIIPGSSDFSVQFFPAASMTYFQINPFDPSGPISRRLWRTDGTVAGTFPLLDLDEFLTFGAVVGDRLFFANAGELRVTDGTVAGTDFILDLGPDQGLDGQAVGDILLFIRTDDSGQAQTWRSDGSPEGTLPLEGTPVVGPGVALSGGLGYFAPEIDPIGSELWAIHVDEIDPGLALRLSDAGRFQISVTWHDPFGNRGSGTGRAASLTHDTGYFWFFRDTNVELVVKVLDGRPLNGHFWVFYGSLSNVEYTITVRDTRTGVVKTYSNPATRFASVGDTTAFPDDATDAGLGAFSRRERSSTSMREPAANAPVVPTTAAPSKATFAPFEVDETSAVVEKGTGTCTSTATVLCLRDGRFEIEVDWHDPFGDRGDGEGQAMPLTTDTGYFWFFRDTNVELMVKVLDGRPINGRFWFFYGALSNVEYTVTVTDTVTGAVQTYDNPGGTFASRGDTQAF